MTEPIQAAIEALKFYADKSNYAPDISEVTGVKPGTGVMEYDISNIEKDEGAKARDALVLIRRDALRIVAEDFNCSISAAEDVLSLLQNYCAGDIVEATTGYES